MAIEPGFSFLPDLFLVKLDPLLLVVVFGGVKGMGVEGVELVLEKDLSF